MFDRGSFQNRFIVVFVAMPLLSACASLPPSDNTKSAEFRAARSAIIGEKENIYDALVSTNADQAIVVVTESEVDILPMRYGRLLDETDLVKLNNENIVCAYYYPLSTPLPATWVQCGTAQARILNRTDIEQLQAQVESLHRQLLLVRTSIIDQDLELTEKYGELEIIVKDIEEKIENGTVLTSDVVAVLVSKIEELKVRVDAGIPDYSN